MTRTTAAPKTTSWPCCGADHRHTARDARQEPDERGAGEDPPERAEAGHGRADEELEREEDAELVGLREAVRRQDEQRSRDAGVGGRDPERERLVDGQLDPGGDGRDLAVADGAEGTTDAPRRISQASTKRIAEAAQAAP